MKQERKTSMTVYEPHTKEIAKNESLSLRDTMELGQVFFESGFFKDTRGQAQAVVKIMAGKELGLPPIVSMTSIHVIKDRVTLSAQAMGAIIKGSGEYDYRVKSLTDKECVLVFYQRGEKIGESSFSMEDARKAGVANINKNWDKYPRNMMMARAISNGARWYCPHLISGAYTPEELGAPVDSMGELVESEAPTPKEPRPPVYNLAPEVQRHNGRPVGGETREQPPQPPPETPTVEMNDPKAFRPGDHPSDEWKVANRAIRGVMAEKGILPDDAHEWTKDIFGEDSFKGVNAAFLSRLASAFQDSVSPLDKHEQEAFNLAPANASPNDVWKAIKEKEDSLSDWGYLLGLRRVRRAREREGAK